MHKGSFANEDVMEEYLSALLTDSAAKPIFKDTVQQQSVAKLLEVADAPEILPPQLPELEPTKPIAPIVEPVDTIALREQPAKQAEPVAIEDEAPSYDSEFQALFFEVAGLTLAVPLTELGGIHQLEKIGPLFGKPDWFKGVMLHREEKLNVVDTAKWVMPEKYDEKLAESLNYQYLIMLDESGWGLACESLITTTTLLPDDVKWRAGDGKRPWLAGIVKEKMCALVNVERMVSMLNQGMASNDK